ncbi:hypothetical protein SDC9_188830 [bioreactor metagenome]|uniref:Uncharacterized protein n=1 Tax=bioreactor metagenome TaxID=1076179 RepID=A0A645HQN8_9ZZZZ
MFVSICIPFSFCYCFGIFIFLSNTKEFIKFIFQRVHNSTGVNFFIIGFSGFAVSDFCVISLYGSVIIIFDDLCRCTWCFCRCAAVCAGTNFGCCADLRCFTGLGCFAGFSCFACLCCVTHLCCTVCGCVISCNCCFTSNSLSRSCCSCCRVIFIFSARRKR